MRWYLDLDQATKDLADLPLRLDEFSGEEALSQPFRFDLSLSSTDEHFDAKALVGRSITFSVRLESDDGAELSTRYFNGYVKACSAGASRLDRSRTEREIRRRYQLEVVPWLWLLTLNVDCRVFQNKSVIDIVKEIFVDEKYSHVVRFDLRRLPNKEDYPKLDYCVQYRESDLAFVSRLLEQEGIFYFIVHDQNVNEGQQGRHGVVLCDEASDFYASLPDGAKVSMDYTDPLEDFVLTGWDHQHRIVTGQYTVTDYDFQHVTTAEKRTPAKELMQGSPTKIDLPAKNAAGSLLGPKPPEAFDPAAIERPSEQRDVKMTADSLRHKYADRRMEEYEAAHDVVSGASACSYFSPGGKFELSGHHWAHENGAYAIVSIRHAVSMPNIFREDSGAAYANTFTCVPASVNYRPPRSTPRPSIDGTLPALVIGPDGEEVHADKYGRVRIQFFWDRRGARMGQARDSVSCWVRCVQPFAGKGWGGMFIPRVGQEVVVSFEEGNPNRPIITGTVHNEEQPLPYDPSQKGAGFVTALKTNSEGGDGHNELRFYDGKDKEQLFLRAQRDMDVRVNNDSRENVRGRRDETVMGNATDRVFGSRHDITYGTWNMHGVEGLYLTARDEVVLQAGGSFIRIAPDGIRIQSAGNSDVDINCEHPTPETPGGVFDTEPNDADDSGSGARSTPF